MNGGFNLVGGHARPALRRAGRLGDGWIANALANTSVTPIHVTMMFVVAGALAIFFILNKQFWLEAFFLILKSVLDANKG